MVDIENVLENVNHELLQVGSWLNVIGYTRNSPVVREREAKSSKIILEQDASEPPAFVQATMIWSAGAIKLDKYESAARAYQQIHSGG